MKEIKCQSAPAAIGPYAQGVITERPLIFVSGQIPIDPKSGVITGENITEQTERVLENISAILKEAGSDLNKVVKTTVLLKDIADFNEMNEAYAKFFGENRPARAAFQVAALPKGALVEIEAIAES